MSAEDVVAIRYRNVMELLVWLRVESARRAGMTTPMQGDWPGPVNILDKVAKKRIT